MATLAFAADNVRRGRAAASGRAGQASLHAHAISSGGMAAFSSSAKAISFDAVHHELGFRS